MLKYWLPSDELRFIHDLVIPSLQTGTCLADDYIPCQRAGRIRCLENYLIGLDKRTKWGRPITEKDVDKFREEASMLLKIIVKLPTYYTREMIFKHLLN